MLLHELCIKEKLDFINFNKSHEYIYLYYFIIKIEHNSLLFFMIYNYDK